MENIAVIFGGRSAEHDVSIVTAIASIIKPLELTKKYHVEPVYIAKNGAWFWDDKLKDINLYTSGAINDFTRSNKPASIELDGGFKLIKSSGIAGRKQSKRIDIIFPSMHGTYGEDGTLMGLCELAGIPYVGCGVEAGSIAMDKVLTKLLAISCGISVTKFVYFNKQEVERDLNDVIKNISTKLKYPLFVKPAHLGSSIGISRVMNEAELKNGLEAAIHYDNKVLIEEAVINPIEVTLPILGNEEPIPAFLERPLTRPEDFFDFDTKYMVGGKKGKSAKGAQGYSQIPAELPKKLYDQAEQTGLLVYKSLGCSGTARIDMLIDPKTNVVYFNEVNPLPGGLYAHNWNKKGISNVELVQKLVSLAKDRFEVKKALATTFNTNYLKQF